jgi:hypothetical protein
LRLGQTKPQPQPQAQTQSKSPFETNQPTKPVSTSFTDKIPPAPQKKVLIPTIPE